jgi:uncharacterized OB-fold protein
MDKCKELPPSARTTVWHTVTKAAQSGEFILQVCKHCDAVQYPPRELCKDCLEDKLEWEKVSAKGKLISYTALHASTNAFFREHLPRQIALLKLDCGPLIFAHMACDTAKTGDRVSIASRCDMSGEGVFIALLDSADEQAQLNQLKSVLLPDHQDD